jgi:outer membrane scaffolding protein for murein synthesis (MipA/OmpV family)
MNKYLYIFFCIACLFLLPISGPAAEVMAEIQPDAQKNEFSIGIGGTVSTTPYKDYDTQVLPLPLLSYEGQYAYIRGYTAGVKLINRKNLELSAFAGYDDSSFDASDSSDSRMRLLKDRHSSLAAGLETRLTTPYGMFHASASRDMLGQSNGFTGILGYLLSLEYGAMEFVPTIGVYWSDSKYNDYYYGISAKESHKSGLEQYNGSFGFSPYLGLTLDYSITEQWEFFCHGELVRLSNTVKDSPMTGSSHTRNLAFGLTYNF